MDSRLRGNDEVISVDDSEKTELTPANDNPWYWLATVYGEQSGEFIDEELATKNRIAWNRWMAEALSEEERAALIGNGFDVIELTPFSDAEKKEHYAAVLKRSDRESAAFPTQLRPADFSSNRFDQSCDFSGYLFPCSATFHSASFGAYAGFRSATFRSFAVFGLVKFGSTASFESTAFCKYADFYSTTFSKASFGLATFSESANFESATFSSNANFESATFDSEASFVNTKFLSVTTFSDAAFRAAVPKFFGATLHEGTAWHGVEWPPATPNRSDGGNIAQDQVYAYERLKQEMEKLKKHEDEQFFFRKELRARRELVTWHSTYWWLNYLYEKLSNYGYGVVRPLVAFAAIFLVGFGLFAVDPFGFAGTKMSAWHAAHISLANMFGGIPLRTIARNADDVLARPAQAFAIFQTIAGVVLLFLFFLALRNRFRLR